MSRLAALGAAALLPVRLAHELTHGLAASARSCEWEVVVTSRDAAAFVDFDGAGRLTLALVALAPACVGSVAALFVAAYALVYGLTLPENVFGLAQVAAGGLAWALYTWPSKTDRATALGESISDYESD